MKLIYNSKGFTLIEIAIVMVISSIMMYAIVSLYATHKYRADYIKTIDNIEITQNALFEFYGLSGRYPCPADPTLPISDPNFGIEQCRAAITPDCVGTPANITCTQSFSRDADGDTVNDPVMMGMVPVNTIMSVIKDVKFSMVNAIDGYNMRLSYAVSENMTDSTATIVDPVSSELGAIRVEDEFGVSVVEPVGSAHLVIISHGENQTGGYSREGVFNTECTIPSAMWPGPGPAPIPPPGPNVAGIEKDKENCDRNDAIFIKGLQSRANSDDYYDDILFFTTNKSQSLWLRSFLSPPGESYLYNTNIGNVGVGTNTPNVKLHVTGDVNAENAIVSDRYCDIAGEDCLLPEAIGGSGSTCPNGEAAIGIENNAVVCQSVFDVVPVTTCPAGEFLNGFSNLGNIRCCDSSGNCNIYP